MSQEVGPDRPRRAPKRGVERRGLHGRLVDRVGQMIVAGELPGDKPLVPEELGAILDVSRTVVRETLRVLESKGMVVARPRVGTRVRPQCDWNLLDSDVITWRQQSDQQKHQQRELAELRSALEPAAARLAAERADAPTVRRLAAAYAAMEAALRSGELELFRAADMTFHAVILAACGNRLFMQLSDTVAAALRSREQMVGSLAQIDPRAMELHHAVLEAIRLRDAPGAEAAMRQIVDESAQHLLSD